MAEIMAPDKIQSETLDLGCGQNKIPGSVGMDRVAGPGVDVVHDLSQSPWPFEDNTFSFVRMSHIIEHLPDVLGTMLQIHRICKPGARVHISTPHFSSPNSWTDPTHCQHLAYNSMEVFTDKRRYNYVPFQFEYEKREITFGKSLLCLPGRFFNWISPEWYERHFCYLFPARDLEFILIVKK